MSCSHAHTVTSQHDLLGRASVDASHAGEHRSQKVAKFIVASANHATCAQDGETLNNYVEVASDCSDPDAVAARARLLSDDATLTTAERARLEQHFGVRR